MKLDDTQLAAVDFALSKRVSVINGGAGTGKTTIVKTIADQLKANRRPFALCSPTGKAAARLKEATRHHASTIHSLLKGPPGGPFQCETLKGTVVVVDESSMADSWLLAEIVKREPDKLVLVGDQAQLPPVGHGQPFHDIIAIQPGLVKTLTTCYRQSEAVFKAAMAIRRGECPVDHEESAGERWDMFATGEAARTEEVLVTWAKQGFFDFSVDTILCPRNGKRDQGGGFPPSTLNSLNRAIARVLFPGREDDGMIEGDRVICTENQPELDVWNGTTGTIQSIDREGRLYIKLDIPIVDTEHTDDPENPVYKDIVLFEKDKRKHLDLAYALTVHRSQGSQYGKVVFVCLKRDSRALLDRSLVYTGVTRTKRQCVVVGEMPAFREAVGTVRGKQTVLQLMAEGM